MRPRPIKPGPDQESVWDYPRPPVAEPVHKRVRILYAGRKLADSTRAVRVLETSHPPVYYIPLDDIDLSLLQRTPKTSFCEFKGEAVYYDLKAEGREAKAAAWAYPNPSSRFEIIKNHVAFYAAPMDSCTVGDHTVEPQPGGFYGGWVTPDVVGPFKGTPGSWGW